MLIRRATIRDSLGLARVQVDSYRTAYAEIWSQELLDHFSYEEQAQDWRDWMTSKPDDLLYVAQTGDAAVAEIVGYALARPGPTDVPPYDSELLALHVHPTRYRQGIGRRLVTSVAERLRQEGCDSLMLWTMEQNQAHGFYRRLGGQLLDARKTSGSGAAEVVYGWPDIELFTQPRR
jgi:ribosomal protein S18 acetylase RimI-like enzyme